MLLCIIVRYAMEKFVENTILYDFYGELLTDHQRRVYESVVFDDLSLAEAAEQENISRQGVHDIIKRCNASLAAYEEKLHLMERFRMLREKAETIRTAAGLEPVDKELIIRMAEEILEEL